MEMRTHDTYGEYLRRIREEKGLRLRDLAEVLDCSVAYVSDVERGTRAPFCDDDLKKLASYLTVPELEMLSVAHRSRSRFILDGKSISQKKRELAVKLVQCWDSMPDDQAEKISCLLP